MKRIEFESSIKFNYLLPKNSDNDLFKNSLLLARGRDALKILIEDMNLPQDSGVLLPAFACEEIYHPFLDSGLKIHYYRVNQDLTPDISHIQQIKDDCRVILLINYFGFLQPISVYDQLKKWGLIVIEDGSHSLLSKGSGEQGDYYFASMRKLLPLLDGAILQKGNGDTIKTVSLKKSKPLVKFRIFRALGQLIKASDNKKPRGIKHWAVRELFALAEKNLSLIPVPAAMSALSKNILSHLNLEKIRDKRRNHYQILQEGIRSLPDFKLIFKDLPYGVTPYGLPVLVDRRNIWLNALENLKIQAAPLWPLSCMIHAEVINDSKIYEQTLLFPLSQDYSQIEMEYLVERLQSLTR